MTMLGIQSADVCWLTALGPALVVLGGYRRPGTVRLWRLWRPRQSPVVVVNPRQVRDFAKGHREAGQDRRPGRGGARPLRRGGPTSRYAP